MANQYKAIALSIALSAYYQIVPNLIQAVQLEAYEQGQSQNLLDIELQAGLESSLEAELQLQKAAELLEFDAFQCDSLLVQVEPASQTRGGKHDSKSKERERLAKEIQDDLKKSEKFVRNEWLFNKYLMKDPGGKGREPNFYTFNNRSESIERNETRLAELAAMGRNEFSANSLARRNETQPRQSSATQITSRTQTSSSPTKSQPTHHRLEEKKKSVHRTETHHSPALAQHKHVQHKHHRTNKTKGHKKDHSLLQRDGDEEADETAEEREESEEPEKAEEEKDDDQEEAKEAKDDQAKEEERTEEEKDEGDEEAKSEEKEAASDAPETEAAPEPRESRESELGIGKAAGSTRKPKRYVHLIPHTHNNQAGLTTEDNLFSGQESGTIYIGGLRDILDSVVDQLIQYSNLTFTYSEIKFFQKWYGQQTPQLKEEVQKLVKQGRLDLVSGGWSSPDEAVTQYDDILDNYMLGQRFLKEEFDFHPQVSWQVDSLGISTGYARLAHDVGHNLQLFSNLDLQEIQEMRRKKTRVQVWRAHEENFGKKKEILTTLVHQNGNSSVGAYCFAQGFYVDVNYLLDAPLVVNKTDPKYNFGKIVQSFYHQMNDQFKSERTNHVFTPFGCDFAFVDAKLNYKVMELLMSAWKDFGYDQDIELTMSTPTRYLKVLQELDKDMSLNGTANATASATSSEETARPSENSTEDQAWLRTFTNMTHKVSQKGGWPIRRDDGFPFQKRKGQFLSGYYSSRPQLKKEIKELSQKFHSSQRLLVQQLLRQDLSVEQVDVTLNNQNEVMGMLADLQQQGAITGTSVQKIANTFLEKARSGKASIDKYNTQMLQEKLLSTHAVKIEEMDAELGFQESMNNLTAKYAHYGELLFIVQNPSPQVREDWVELQLPYFNFTINELVGGQLVQVTSFEKFLPKTWLQSNQTMVRSIVQFKVQFSDPNEVAKVFIIKNLGVVKAKNPHPSFYKADRDPINLNLPIFKQRNPWDIWNFQSNFRKLRPYGDKIQVGKKTLKFIGIKKTVEPNRRVQDLLSQTAMEQQYVSQQTLISQNFTSVPNSTHPGAPNSTLPNQIIRQKVSNLQLNSTAKGDKGSASGSKASGGQGGKKKNDTRLDENEGAAIFLYEDEETGVRQKFAFSLRYYLGNTHLRGENDTRQDGAYEFSPEVTAKGEQKSYRYGQIVMKLCQHRQNNDSAEFVLMWEQKYSPRPELNNTDRIRASARISMNSFEDFVKFQVTLNEVPISLDLTGKDVVVDWHFLDDFEMDKKFWVDANGLQMMPKRVNHRREYAFDSNQTISSNYYPMTSAIAIRDYNQTNWRTGLQKQIVIMAEQAHGASAGLRGGKNIEIMQQRRHHRYDSHGINEALNETDSKGRGQRNREVYYMQLTNVAAQNQSRPQETHRSFQREKQLRIDQPILTYYSHKYELPKGNQELDLANSSSDLTAVLAIQNKADALRGSTSGNNVATLNGTHDNAIQNQNVNTNYKNAKTLKATVYGIKQNEIQLRLSNLDDRFDGNYSQTYEFNINAWAREYYLEANAHLMIDPKLKPIAASNSDTHATLNSTALTTQNASSALTATTMNATHQKKNSSDILAGLTLDITEMNLAGSISLSTLRNQAHNNTIRQSNWTTNKAEDPALIWKEPVDFIHDVQISSGLSEKIHIIQLEPQSIRVFNIKYLTPGAHAATHSASTAQGSATEESLASMSAAAAHSTTHSNSATA